MFSSNRRGLFILLRLDKGFIWYNNINNKGKWEGI